MGFVAGMWLLFGERQSVGECARVVLAFPDDEARVIVPAPGRTLVVAAGDADAAAGLAAGALRYASIVRL